MNLREIIQEIVKDNEEMYSLPCEVVDVNETERTLTARPLNGDADIYGVRLQSSLSSVKGLVQIPKVGSFVVVTFISKNTGYVALCEEVDKVLIDCDEITINGGGNDGVVIVGALVDKINRLESEMNEIKTLLSTWTPVPSDGGASLKAFVATWASQTLTPTTKTDLENTKFKH